MSKLSVAFQGELGAYSEEAAYALLGGEIDVRGFPSFREVYTALSTGAVDRAVVPVENALAGAVHENLDLPLEFGVHFIAERDHRIHHCLLGLPGATVDSLHEVRSHPQALAQCAEYLRRVGLKSVPEYDTAGAARLLAEKRTPGAGVLASARAAERYGLSVLAEGITGDLHNATRFRVVAREPYAGAAVAKTALVIALPNRPGALHALLAPLAERDLPLLKLESRPRRGRPFESVFFLDVEGALAPATLEKIRAAADWVQVLGAFPRV